mmetsp:Transcript_11148/g.46407  ORF Transcript_11148/g.46407 Transcript_11148/m.46407 type:complete len:246 (-) Transcript_11148:842-1579(-)
MRTLASPAASTASSAAPARPCAYAGSVTRVRWHLNPAASTCEKAGTNWALRLTSGPTSQSVWLASTVVPGAFIPSFAHWKAHPANAVEASAYSLPPHTSSLEHWLTTSTTKRKAKSSCLATSPPPFSFFRIRSSSSSLSAIASTGAVSVTSSTLMPNFHPSTAKSFWSPRTIAYGPRLTIQRVLHRNICRATLSGLSTPPCLARSATAKRSASVVVTDCRLSVSDRMAHMSSRATSGRILALRRT